MKRFIPQRLHDCSSLKKLKIHYRYMILKRAKKLEIRMFSTLYGMTIERAKRTLKLGRTRYCNWNVEEGNPPPSLFDRDWKNICGPVRNQRSHGNCWSYAVTDCFSGRRLLTGEDAEFRIFSAKYLTYYCSEDARVLEVRDGVAHKCHPYNNLGGFRFLQDPGVPEQDPKDMDADFDCVNDPPPENPPLMYKLGEEVEIRVSDKLEDLYKMLDRQPVTAVLLDFFPEMHKVGEGIYRGPASSNSVYIGKHDVVITAIKRVGGELVAIVKNSHGLRSGEQGYFKVLLTRMVYGLDIKNPTLLISGFTCPMLPPKAESKSKSESDDAIDVSHESENKRKRTDSHESESHQKKRASGRESESHQKKRASESESASKPPASKKAKTTAGREDSVLLDHTETKPCQKL